MRYITYHASEYGIDTSMIFIGGQSAGMMGVMTNIYMSQQNINQIYPGLEDKYGSIDESTNSIDITYSVKGIINMWGAIPDTTFINSNENIPIINFYGERDNVVPPVSYRFRIVIVRTNTLRFMAQFPFITDFPILGSVVFYMQIK